MKYELVFEAPNNVRKRCHKCGGKRWIKHLLPIVTFDKSQLKWECRNGKQRCENKVNGTPWLD